MTMNWRTPILPCHIGLPPILFWLVGGWIFDAHVISFVVVILLPPWAICPDVGGDNIYLLRWLGSIHYIIWRYSMPILLEWLVEAMDVPVSSRSAINGVVPPIGDSAARFCLYLAHDQCCVRDSLPCCCRFNVTWLMMADGVGVLCYGTADKLRFWMRVAVILSVFCRHVVLVGCLLACCFCLLWYLASISMHYLVEMLVSRRFWNVIKRV